jgi:hypothetical protein
MGVSRRCLGARGGELRGVARGNRRTQASPMGNAAGGGVRPAAARPHGFGVWPEGDVLGVAREPHHEPQARGRAAGGPGRQGRAAVRRAPRG